jgi:hypothetical protein
MDNKEFKWGLEDMGEEEKERAEDGKTVDVVTNDVV